MKCAAMVVLMLLMTFGPAPASARELPLDVYRARLGTQDHFNSKGKRLKSAAGIIRQDRANYHKFNKKDPEDQGDVFFAKRKNRALLEKMLQSGTLDKAARKAILSGVPLVEVSIYQNRLEVLVLEEGDADDAAGTGSRNRNGRPKLVDGCKPGPGDEVTEQTTYVARLSSTDHFNSKGKRLKSAAAIIRQDRANYHKFKKRDSEDQSDGLFGERENRGWLDSSLDNCLNSNKLKKAIMDGTPLVRVTATTQYDREIGYENGVVVELLSK